MGICVVVAHWTIEPVVSVHDVAATIWAVDCVRASCEEVVFHQHVIEGLPIKNHGRCDRVLQFKRVVLHQHVRPRTPLDPVTVSVINFNHTCDVGVLNGDVGSDVESIFTVLNFTAIYCIVPER